jgi:hypothetical protein
MLENDKRVGGQVRIAVMVVVLLASYASAQTKAIPKSTTKYECKESQDEKCPTAEDYVRIKEWLAKYAAPQDELDRFTGLVQRVARGAPPGWYLDQIKWVYLKNPPAAPLPPQPESPAK